jgi:glycerol dehydrogenase-like iron-containing ADH family enzyme
VGIGAGAAIDTAKWIHSRRGLRLFQLPSLPSVDACFTRAAAVRDGRRVRYEGDATADRIIVDFELMDGAEPSLLAAGIGDVLSCHTACWDWRLAAQRGKDHPLDAGALRAAADHVDELEAIAPLLAARHDDGIRALMELLRAIGIRCDALGHARFEEGSEHFFAYAFEEVTGRSLMHGELVTVGVIVMSALQGNDPHRPRRIASLAGTRTGLDALGITPAQLEATLRRLPSYVRDEKLWWSVIDEITMDDSTLATASGAMDR